MHSSNGNRRTRARLKGCAAFTAKLRLWGILETALGAAAREPSPALDAELRAVAIVEPARRTAHGLDPRADYTPHSGSRGTVKPINLASRREGMCVSNR